MGLFSNLFGQNGKDIDNALGRMKDLAEDIANTKYADEDEKRVMQTGTTDPDAMPLRDSSSAASFVEEGDSWGPNMPAEENQYNSGLSYLDYFSKIFKNEFSSYDVEILRLGSKMISTFYQDGTKKLVVEVISENNNPVKLRNECRANGVPYLRFYHNHEGWWNTRSYVVRRISEALSI